MGRKKVKNILEASYLNQNEASQKLKGMGYSYDPQLSTNESKVFISPSGVPNIAFRGTHKFRVKDLISDLAVVSGLQNYDTRFKETKHLTKLVEDKYHKPANVFGYSLGGNLAEHSGASGKIFTHNKATGVGDLFKDIPKTQTDYRNKNDVVSLLSLTQNHQHNNLKEKQTQHDKYDVLGNHGIIF